MSFAIAARNTLRRSTAVAANKVPAFSTVFVRNKATLPKLDYDFDALEPYISGQINEVSSCDLECSLQVCQN